MANCASTTKSERLPYTCRYYDAERETVAPIGPIEEPQHEIEKLSTPTDHVTSTPGPSTRTLSRIGSKYPEISDISSAESHNV